MPRNNMIKAIFILRVHHDTKPDETPTPCQLHKHFPCIQTSKLLFGSFQHFIRKYCSYKWKQKS